LPLFGEGKKEDENVKIESEDMNENAKDLVDCDRCFFLVPADQTKNVAIHKGQVLIASMVTCEKCISIITTPTPSGDLPEYPMSDAELETALAEERMVRQTLVAPDTTTHCEGKLLMREEEARLDDLCVETMQNWLDQQPPGEPADWAGLPKQLQIVLNPRANPGRNRIIQALIGLNKGPNRDTESTKKAHDRGRCLVCGADRPNPNDRDSDGSCLGGCP
jgi:hypothetical protein